MFAKTLAALVAIVLAAGSADAADRVNIGMLNSASSWSLLIADEEGYFTAEGIEPNFVIFDSGAKMIPSLSTGQLGAGAGAAASGVYNAVERGIRVKVVADAVRNQPGYGELVLVRTDLMKSGAIKGLADLRARRVAITNAASTEASSLAQAMESVGLTYADVDTVFLGFPDHLVAFQNRAIDASLTSEPNATAAIRSGAAMELMGVDAYYPNSEVALLMYGSDFLGANRPLGIRFMKAYLRGVRAYNDALHGSHIAGDKIVAILAKRSNVHDPAVLRAMRANGNDPDGRIDTDTMQHDWTFFKAQGQISGKVTVADIVDPSFAAAAVKDLGPYK